MSTAALKTLTDSLKRNVFNAAYYLCGEDDFQKESAMKQLIAGALDPSIRDFNLDVHRAQDIDPKFFDGIVSSMPMMADRRVIVIRDVGNLRREGRKAVEKYLQDPSPDVMLLLIDGAGGKPDKDLMRMTTVLEFGFLSADRIPKWITHHAAMELKIQISTGASELLQAAVGNDLYRLVAELDKLSSYTGGREITEDAVTAVVGIRRGETMTDLLDAIARRNVKEALMLVDHILSQPKTTAVGIVMLLAAQTAALAWGRMKLDEGLPVGRLQSEYFNLLKQSGSVYLGRSWSTAAVIWSSTANLWPQHVLQRAFDALLMADVTLKESRLSSEEQVLTTLILTMCSDDGQQIAA
jgi:DNA polymerase-3 subunit delta